MRKIFIIEDDEVLLRMFERIFTAEQCKVESAQDGADGVAKLYMMTELPSAILLDIMIPIISGVEVLKLIKNSNRLKNIPVIIMSNLTPPKETEEKIVALGAIIYMHKSDHTPQGMAKKVMEIISLSTAVPTLSQSGTAEEKMSA